MSHRRVDSERERSETQQWFEREKLRRAQAAQRVAQQRRRVDGFSVIRLPSLAEGLDEIQPPPTRFAGRASE